MKILNTTIQKSLLAASVTLLMSSAFAGQVNPEIEQLRQEIKELRAMLQINMETQKSLAQKRVEQAAPVVTQAPQPIQQTLTKSGAEFNLYGYIRADASYQIKGASSMYNNISGVPLENTPEENEFDTVSLGITHQFTPQIRSTLGYGYMKAKDDNRFAELQRTSTTQNKQLWQGWVNALYNPYKPITLGIEYVYGERETFDNRNGIDNRFNMIASYDF
ncbi:DcaP family trimeric outer membrane transporter [Acinetobacter baumannii]|nr:DcaP family trimeric outer membrane transporter [Acinetobacter baumannii]